LIGRWLLTGLRFFQVCVLSMASLSVAAKEIERSWQLIREDSGVVSYSSETSGAGIIAVRTEVVINADMEKVLSVLDDVAYRKEWVPYLVEARVLKLDSATDKLEYSLFSAPWPATDRDFVYRQRLLHKDNKKIIFTMSMEESDLMAVQEGVIRADLIESQYTLTAISNNQTHVKLVFSADPKGWLPGWLVNMIQEKLPYQMLRNLRNKIDR